MKKKTYHVRALEFFNKTTLHNNFKNIEKYNTPENIRRLEKFWKLWLNENKKDPTESLYCTVYKLLICNTKSDIYSEFCKLKLVKPNSLEHASILYGAEEGINRYNQLKNRIKTINTLESSEKVDIFLNRKAVRTKLHNIEITDSIRYELHLLFENSPKIAYNFDHNDIVSDLIIYFSPDFINRFNIIKKNNHVSSEYRIARYGEQADAKHEIYITRQRKNATANFKNVIEYWISKGVDLETAYQNVQSVQSDRAKRAKLKNTGAVTCRSVDFWIAKNHSVKESINIVKNIQRRDLSFFIAKYGEEAGAVKFYEMINNRLVTWNNRSVAEKNKINSSKGRTYLQLIADYGIDYADDVMIKRASSGGAVSLESINFFKELDTLLSSEISTLSVTGYKGPERWVKTDKSFYFLDYIVKNCVIEYNGSFWHADPRKYEADDYHSIKQMTSAEIWKYDKDRIDNLKKLNYNVLVVWSDDVVNDKQLMLTKCKDFINEHYRISSTD